MSAHRKLLATVNDAKCSNTPGVDTRVRYKLRCRTPRHLALQTSLPKDSGEWSGTFRLAPPGSGPQPERGLLIRSVPSGAERDIDR
jgi:hypothetical protein